jgi:hypothetical protein
MAVRATHSATVLLNPQGTIHKRMFAPNGHSC